MIVAELMGGMRLYHPKSGDCTPRARKSAAIVGYLMRSKHRVERRERLAGLLWSESTESHAREALRQCIMELRRLTERINVPFLHADRQDVRLDPQYIQSDLDQLSQCLAKDETLEEIGILERQNLSLLHGFEDVDPSFGDWLLVEREAWSQETIARSLGGLERADGGREARLRLVLRLDPFNEQAVELQMRSLVEAGRASEALRVYDAYAASLRHEYAVAPGDALKNLCRTTRQMSADLEKVGGRVDRSANREDQNVKPRSSTQKGNPDQPKMIDGIRLRKDPTFGVPTIAVLSIDGRFDGGEGQKLDELANELFSALTRFKEWIVLATTPHMLELKSKTTGEIAQRMREEGIEYVLLLRGSKGGQRSSATLQLVECATGRVEFSESYVVDMPDGAMWSNTVTRRVASKVQVVVPSSRLRKIAVSSPKHRAAYDYCMEGVRALRSWTTEGHLAAKLLLDKALELDGSCAAAYANLASLLNSRWFMFPGEPASATELTAALEHARRALHLDPYDGLHHLNLAWNHMIARRHSPAELHFRTALELNPFYPHVVMACAEAFAFLGDRKTALELSNQAFEMTPLRPAYFYSYKAFVDLLSHDFAGCVESVLHAPDVFPNIMCLAAVSNAFLGKMPEAVAAREQFYADMRARWQGRRRPDNNTLDRWMVETFLAKNDEDRDMLRSGLARIAAYLE